MDTIITKLQEMLDKGCHAMDIYITLRGMLANMPADVQAACVPIMRELSEKMNQS